MKNRVLELTKKYGLKEIQDSLNILENIKVKIGFLGEFNSGKSSLINTLIGEKVLPVMIKPTTRSIVEIEPIENLEAKKFYKKENSNWIDIEESEFTRIAIGEEEGTAKVEVLANEYLKEDFIFIDTPGISSLDKLDQDITFGYLPFLDGVVICQDIQQGSFTKSIIDFISKKEIRPIINNFIFVLTKRDTKLDKDAQKVLENIIDQIKLIDKEKNLGIENIDKKATLASSKNLNGLDEFKKSLELNITDRFNTIEAQKEQRALISMLKEIKEALEYRIENIDIDDKELKEKKESLKADLEQIEKEKEKLEDNLERFRKELDRKLSNVVENYIPLLEKAESDEISDVIGTMNYELSETAKYSIERYFKDINMPQLPSDAFHTIENFLAKINKTKDIAVLVSTAIATAYLGGATGLAGNAEEAAEGASVVAAGKEIAKQTGKEAAKSVGKRILLGIAQTLKTINPFEYIGEIAKQFYLDSSLNSRLQSLSNNISFGIYLDIKSSLESDVFAKLREDIDSKQKSLEYIKKERRYKQNDLEKLKQEMFDDVLDLKMWLNRGIQED